MSKLRGLDARWFVFGNNALLLVWGLAFFGLQRSNVQIVTCAVTTLGCEIAFARLGKKRRTSRLTDRALSAATAAVSTLILLQSPAWWFYAVAGAIAIASKYVILDAAGNHVFNPTNFAIVFAIALFPGFLFVRPDQFSGSPLLMAQIIGFGLLAVVRGARWRTTFGYYATIVGVALPVGMLLGIKPLWILAPELNTSTLVFAFLMLTDPKTTPTAPRHQVAFGVGVALVHIAFRYTQVPYSPFIALFAMAALRSAWIAVSHAPAAPALKESTPTAAS